MSGRYRPDEKLSLTKHVVAAGIFVRDAGSTPAASTILGLCFVEILDSTGQIRDNFRMKAKKLSPGLGTSEMAQGQSSKSKRQPIVVSEGSVSVKIYRQINRLYQRVKDEATGKLVLVRDPRTGKKLVLSEHPQFELVYWSGSRRIKQKFTELPAAMRAAERAAIKLANGESDALKLSSTECSDYVRAINRLKEINPKPDLNLAVADYVSAVRQLPTGTFLKECVDFYVKRNPVGIPSKTVQEVVDELLLAKSSARRSDRYIDDIRGRLYQFAGHFNNIRLASITGQEIEAYLRSLGAYSRDPDDDNFRPLSGRSQNNHRRAIGLLTKFAIKRGYLPKDYSELDAVEKAQDGGGEIEIFTPDELRRLISACLAPVVERGKERNRAELIPYLTIGAFAGLRAAELERLDWSEVNIPRRFIEIKACKAKTASRRLAPITENLAAWLAPHALPSGKVATFDNMSKQLTLYLAPQAGMKWKHNGLRHSFISYRLADIKNMAQVSLEAGNSPQMIFKHYRELVDGHQAQEWFGIAPAAQTSPGEIIPMPPPAAVTDSVPQELVESLSNVAHS